jgi:NADH-quinone oxidoreductase subunit H
MGLDLAIVTVKVLFMFAFVMGIAGLLTWVERKQSAVIQDRIGANRASIFGIRMIGLFHPIADALKLFTKEDFVPPHGHRALFLLSPALAIIPALMTFAVIPFGDHVRLFGRELSLRVSDIDPGIIFVFAIASLSVYGISLAGWASDNRYGLLGALRGAAQMFSYEVVLGLSVVGILMAYGSVDLNEIVRAQGGAWWGIVPKWGVFIQPLGFILYLTAAFAETKRVPFDLPEGESEIVAGYFIEYSGMKYAAFLFSEFCEMILVAGLSATLFFGGWQLPWVEMSSWPQVWVTIVQMATFTLKVVVFLWLLMQIRWTLPRFRYDQVMALCWKGLLPLALLNIMVTAVIVLALGV